MKCNFIVYGLAPAISKQANEFMKACDLGGEGAFVKESQEVTLTLDSDKNKDKIPDVLKKAYEKELGWHDVVVLAN